MFEKAVRIKLRFATVGGSLNVEDLWDLPLTSTRGRANLNDIAKSVSKELRETTEEEFVNPKPKADDGLQLKMDIVKHVIAIRQAENEVVKIVL